jgi:hypothetical protein
VLLKLGPYWLCGAVLIPNRIAVDLAARLASDGMRCDGISNANANADANLTDRVLLRCNFDHGCIQLNHGYVSANASILPLLLLPILLLRLLVYRPYSVQRGGKKKEAWD